MLTENKRIAYFTAAFDLSGALKIQQVQYRMVLDRDGIPVQELEILPIELLHVAEPTPQDTVSPTLVEALGEVASGAMSRCLALETEIAERKVAFSEKSVEAEGLVAQIEVANAAKDEAEKRAAEYAAELAAKMLAEQAPPAEPEA